MIPERRITMNNDDKLREHLNSEPVPESLKPENIKIMLDNEAASQKKRKGIAVSRITAAAAACAVIGGTAAYNLNNNKLSTDQSNNVIVADTTKHDILTPDAPKENNEVKKQFSYMNSASDYTQVYNMFKEASDKTKKEQERNERLHKFTDDADFGAVAESADESTLTGTFSTNGDAGMGGGSDPSDVASPIIEKVDSDEETAAPAAEAPDKEDIAPATEGDPDHSETYFQEQDVLEADIVKTDGRHIFCICNKYDENISSDVSLLRVASVKDGKFTSKTSVNVSKDIANSDSENSFVSIADMYIYNDMIVVIGNDYSDLYSDKIERSIAAKSCGRTFVAFYTKGDAPELIDVYYQDGFYSDTRIAPDGNLLVITTYSSFSFDDVEKNYDELKFIPCYGMKDDVKLVPAEDILLPSGGFTSNYNLSYSVISSIDLNESGAPKPNDIKSLAGYTGSIYCSADNLYTAAYNWDEYDKSDITRISVKDGKIVPMAGTTIDGHIKDQFSMSEYDGYFRVAATYTETKKTYHKYDDEEEFIDGLWNWITTDDGEGYYTYETIKTDTRVYVLDMDMNMVGSVDGLGVDEQLKSASFSGNMAYVVTFRQTDPLYAVDLSSPEKPVVLDEFKINGYSSYMQSWGDGLLLGFGQDGDDDGNITGLKLTMFDNSDPNNLKALDSYTWHNDLNYDFEEQTGFNEWYSSYALWDRKALLIAPEKNIIGVPINHDKTTYSQEFNPTSHKYDFFRFEDGKFVYIGNVAPEITEDTPFEQYDLQRALYIGDHVYVIANSQFIAADINTLEITDKAVF